MHNSIGDKVKALVASGKLTPDMSNSDVEPIPTKETKEQIEEEIKWRLYRLNKRLKRSKLNREKSQKLSLD